MANLKNLKPWKPGQSGNPGGRPKKRPITDEYYSMSQKPCPERIRKALNKKAGQEVLVKGATWAEASTLSRFLASCEVKEGHRSSKEIREAMEGRAPMRLEITGTEKKKITLLVKHDRKK